MSKLVSGMMLLTEDNGSYQYLHYLIGTPYGFKVIDSCGALIEFEQDNYSKAYIPKDYDDPWVPVEGSEIIF